MSQKGRKKNTKADDKSKSDYFSWSDDEVQLLLLNAAMIIKHRIQQLERPDFAPNRFLFDPVDKTE